MEMRCGASDSAPRQPKNFGVLVGVPRGTRTRSLCKKNWLLNCIMKSVSKEHNRNSKCEWQVGHQRGQVDNRKDNVQPSYRNSILSRWKIHLVFHTSLLMTYKETAEHGSNFLQSPPDLIDGEEEYEVEVVIGHRGKPG